MNNCVKCLIKISSKNKSGYCRGCYLKFWSIQNNRQEYKQQWAKNNRDKINSIRKNRWKNDINYRLAYNLRNRLYCAIKNNQKIGSAVNDLGCSIEELKKHLESKFTEGMTWENHGNDINKWNIDHITPISSFDLTDIEQVKKACHYTNLQPLWYIDNILKGDL